MADASHLERMGRELKCPICLSLLTSAASLACNHVFCKSCILKSMKSASSCPVCKVPYQRREVRPAPHMDNLVSVYKSMEVASGINILVTQNAPSSDHSCKVQEAGEACQDRVETERKCRGKGSKRLLKANSKSFSPNTEKPSFPKKKRVQVPQNPLSETPLLPKKFEDGLDDFSKGHNESSVVNKKPDTNEKKEPALSPFFWLREDEDAEKLSDLSEGNHFVDTPLVNVPSFSDIKDSDDEMLSNMMKEGKVQSKSNIADCFDSEMFEWTQRPCSPELCSSPSKMQVADSVEFDEIQEKELNTVLQDSSTYDQNPCSDTFKADGHCKTKDSKKRGRKASENAQKKHTKKDADQNCEYHVAANKIVESVQEQKSDRNGKPQKLKNSTCKTTKKVGSYKSVIQSTPEGVPSFSVEFRPSNEVVTDVSNLPAPSGNRHGSSEDFSMKTMKNCERINTEGQKVCPVRSRNRKRNFSIDITLQNVPQRVGQRNEVPTSESILLSPPTIENAKLSNYGGRTSKHARESKSSTTGKCNGALRCSKKMKVSIDDVFGPKVALDIKKDHSKIVAAKETPSLENNHSHSKDLDHASTATKAPVVLRKCKSVANQIKCAFCHSAEDSEASGEMVHYLNGQPIQAVCSEGCDIIHSHRNCTEWAPNVYFEDETAINLESELARSRRIKCSLCGEKGAALGCYEKSCRRSFHFPCVKLVPQCRWDTDNFVMFCPVHASSKLPNEIPIPQRKERKKCILKGNSHDLQAQVAVKQDRLSSCRENSFGSRAKFVLCCSALRVAEREIVSEFERLSRASVLKKWDSSVTHVIASTDERGACKRTLKVLMGIIEGKWILSIEWIKACMKVTKPVNEEHYEINVDIHGFKDGPRLGRLRLLNKEPKLFDGLKFYFTADFVPSYKGYLQDLVIAAGGTVLHRKPISNVMEAVLSDCSTSSTFIIYSLEPPEKCDSYKKNLIFNCRRVDAEALSHSSRAKVASNLWVLNSIAACKLHSFAE